MQYNLFETIEKNDVTEVPEPIITGSFDKLIPYLDMLSEMADHENRLLKKNA